jgi:hypothetical protein
LTGNTFRTGVRRGLDRSAYESWQQSTKAAGRRPGSVLAWQLTADRQYVIAATGLLSISSGDHDRPSWQHLGWHRIEHGTFNADTNTLSWTLYPDTDADQRPDPAARAIPAALTLLEPGRLPEVFRDRVAASITVRQFIALDDSEPVRGKEDRRVGVIVSGRRDLSDTSSPIEWRVSLPRGTRWDTPGIEELATAAVARLRADYDPDP